MTDTKLEIEAEVEVKTCDMCGGKIDGLWNLEVKGKTLSVCSIESKCKEWLYRNDQLNECNTVELVDTKVTANSVKGEPGKYEVVEVLCIKCGKEKPELFMKAQTERDK